MKKEFYVLYKVYTNEMDMDDCGTSILGIFESNLKAHEAINEIVREALNRGMTLDDTDNGYLNVLLIDGVDRFYFYARKEMLETDLE